LRRRARRLACPAGSQRGLASLRKAPTTQPPSELLREPDDGDVGVRGAEQAVVAAFERIDCVAVTRCGRSWKTTGPRKSARRSRFRSRLQMRAGCRVVVGRSLALGATWRAAFPRMRQLEPGVPWHSRPGVELASPMACRRSAHARRGAGLGRRRRRRGIDPAAELAASDRLPGHPLVVGGPLAG